MDKIYSFFRNLGLPAYNIVHLPGNTGSHTVVDAEQTRRFSAAALTQIQIINTIEKSAINIQ